MIIEEILCNGKSSHGVASYSIIEKCVNNISFDRHTMFRASSRYQLICINRILPAMSSNFVIHTFGSRMRLEKQ
jgi:hypothetical protein